MERLRRVPDHLREPIYIPRWVLLLKYAFFAVLAIATYIRGSATLDLTQPDSYTPLWSLAVGCGAVVAFAGCAFPILSTVEKWAAAWIASWLGVWAFNAILTNQGSGWLIVLFVTLLPAGRAIALFSKRQT